MEMNKHLFDNKNIEVYHKRKLKKKYRRRMEMNKQFFDNKNIEVYIIKAMIGGAMYSDLSVEKDWSFIQ